MSLDFLRDLLLKIQKRAQIFARRKMTVSSRVRTGPRSPLFTKMRKLRNFHFFESWSENGWKSRLFDFWTPKATFRAQARGCACSQCFLDAFFGSRELKCNFCVQKSLFSTFPTFASQSHFLAKKWVLSGKVTFELPGLEKGQIFYWFLKGWEPSARTAISDGEKLIFT